jgi:predicted TIM-barrel fold metal-dependent hydrolase
MFPHVSMDIGLAINHTGIQGERLIAESLEVAPMTKVLFSSDAWGLPELHVLGSWLFRRGLSRVLGRWVVSGDWSEGDARRTIALIGSENAGRIYGP